MSLPRIALSGVRRQWQGAARIGVNAAYVDSVAAAGAIPLVLPPTIAPEHALDALEGVDALLLSGGEDIDPAWYGMDPVAQLGAVDPARDWLEFALFAAARERGLPVLGICRGLQLVNVAMGGVLWQDLPSERPSAVQHDRADARDVRSHAVVITTGTRTADALGASELAVNSFHHQGVRTLAPGLVTTAQAADGLVEAFEGGGGAWLLAVQWHPEEMHADPHAPDRGLFAALAEAAREAYCR
jgi:putative glutamine amidotransferase